MRHLLLVAACACAALPLEAKELYRCTTTAGAVEYRDTPCAGSSGERLSIPDDTPTVADKIKAERGMHELRQQSRTIDARIAADAMARQRAREAEQEAADRERRHQELMDKISTPPPEPQVVYVPYAVPIYSPPHSKKRR